jgi:uncharacterized protein YsxB (DUF464 family)
MEKFRLLLNRRKIIIVIGKTRIYVKEVTTASLYIVCSSISKFLTVFISNFNFAQSNFIKNIKRGLARDKTKKTRYSNISNQDFLLNYYININIKKFNKREKFQFLHRN